MFKRFIPLAVLMTALTGCVSLNSVSLTQVPAERSNEISATSSSWTFLGIAFSNDFVDEAVLDLKSQCAGGKVEGILTKFQHTVFIPVVIREVVATGYCHKG
ncbi:hypothetical protein [Thalassolituus pacificus]|uniref:Lipoprotein n=1 Tax=Thalassolituus pacificus TaxID=2975440 RepID=A0A9X2WEK2_9GAMM|nr:hypothetical protein [Thalassolituus pacificus]MCT7358978.1 hypothetical protein [Thalassolituus pacificus]